MSAFFVVLELVIQDCNSKKFSVFTFVFGISDTCKPVLKDPNPHSNWIQPGGMYKTQFSTTVAKYTGVGNSSAVSWPSPRAKAMTSGNEGELVPNACSTAARIARKGNATHNMLPDFSWKTRKLPDAKVSGPKCTESPL